MAKFKGVKLEMKLRANAPMIHFQSNQRGVTLRASEAKPKLDRYLMRWIEKSMGKGQARKEGYFVSGEHDALNYKMRIELREKPLEVVLNGEADKNLNDYLIFYGNSGREEKIYGLFSDPVVMITCFHEGLRKLIEAHLTAFFLSHNFGTMQSKGFGSFVPEECGFRGEMNEKECSVVADALRDAYGVKRCFYIAFDESPLDENYENRNKITREMFEEIQQFYSIMKSGKNRSYRNGDQEYARSFIYEYMHEKYHIDNEKAWMKQNGIAPTNDNSQKNRVDKNPRYVRAFLGTSENISYKSPWKADIKIASKAEKEDDVLNRVPSTIFFKIVGNNVFIIAQEIPEELYGSTYAFSSRDGRGRISVPSKADFSEDALKERGVKDFSSLTIGKFDNEQFLSDYIAYYNGEAPSGGEYIEDKLFKTKFGYSVEEVK